HDIFCKIGVGWMAVLLLPLAACVARPGPDSASLHRVLDQQAPVWLKAYEVPGVSVALIEDGRLVWTVAYGEQDSGAPATDATLYNVASLAKPVSAETMLRLASSGRISLDEPMYRHWIDPDIRDDPRHRLLAPRMSLLHQTGFPNWRYQTEGKLRFLRDPLAEPGYSGEGYEYAARFVQEKLGRRFDRLAQELVFNPVGMRNTSYIGRDWFADRIAVPQGPEGEFGRPAIRDSWVASDDLYTTAADYGRFVACVLRGEGLSEDLAARRFTITDDQHGEMCAALSLAADLCPARMGYALGWIGFEYPDDTIMMHTGKDWGEQTLAFFSLRRRLGVVVLTNGANGMRVAAKVAALLFEHPGFNAFLAAEAS
ncbi:MAG TPA: serine hydrolase domain-containing protein, partial [Gammaproteobacteria bacterium]